MLPLRAFSARLPWLLQDCSVLLLLLVHDLAKRSSEVAQRVGKAFSIHAYQRYTQRSLEQIPMTKKAQQKGRKQNKKAGLKSIKSLIVLSSNSQGSASEPRGPHRYQGWGRERSQERRRRQRESALCLCETVHLTAVVRSPLPSYPIPLDLCLQVPSFCANARVHLVPKARLQGELGVGELLDLRAQLPRVSFRLQAFCPLQL